MKNKYKVIGLMSGTSLDGLDIASCVFSPRGDSWVYKIEFCETVRYPKRIMEQLANAMSLSAADLLELDVQYGRFTGEAVLDFNKRHEIRVDFIASHGHTVFHQPDKGFTLQIGDGNAIYAVTGIPVVYDFRSLDVALGGQGAPLVPAGDEFLFSDYDFCLNLGGIANVSMRQKKERKAFDICFANMGFNYLMLQKGKSFDNRGETAASGAVNSKLLGQLNKLYVPLRKTRPSLGKEIFDRRFKPVLDAADLSVEDKLATFVESTAKEVVDSLGVTDSNHTMLCTGGGAYNTYLVSRILEHCGDAISIIIPDDNIVKFKEALIFAFLGVLRVNGEANCLRSVTGARKNSSGGIMVGFKK